MNPNEARKNFEDALNKLAYTRSLFDVFQDFLDFTLLFMRWWDRKPEHFAELEKKYTTKKEYELFAEAFLCLGPMSDGYRDPFGDYFMEHFSSNRKGQFFTPEHICDLMAALQGFEDKPVGSTICDPTCGSGRTLLSVARINPDCEFYAADIDIICCKMTVINFMLNKMSGEVAWMDTIRMEHWKSWHIGSYVDDNGNILPYYQETGAGDTSFIIRLKNTVESSQTNKVTKDENPISEIEKPEDITPEIMEDPLLFDLFEL